MSDIYESENSKEVRELWVQKLQELSVLAVSDSKKASQLVLFSELLRKRCAEEERITKAQERLDKIKHDETVFLDFVESDDPKWRAFPS